MSKNISLTILLLALSTAVSFSQYNTFDKVSMSMETKTFKGGYTSMIVADIFYNQSGEMVTYYSKPKPYVLMNDAKGDIRIYDQNSNTVVQQQNFTYSTESSQFYYFLNNKKADLGLSEMGFQQTNVTFEDGLMISEWMPPANLADKIMKVELVHEQENPIYIAYYDHNNQVGTKSYYYDYAQLSPLLSFPTTVTQISYSTPTDSTITKTVYRNFAVDGEVDVDKMDFKIPSNAKAIN